jgi:hypothetical protein
MEETTLRVPYLEEGLISHLRGRLGALGASIVISDIWHPALQRDRDIAIMEVLLRLPGVKPTDLIKANMCRKWLRVITIAELASICGTKIPAKHFTGRWRAKSNLNWPNQPSPTPEMWTVFRRLIKRAFCSRAKYFPVRLDVPLDSPLGAWLPSSRHIQHKYYRTSQTIFHRLSDNCYRRYTESDVPSLYFPSTVRHSLPPEAHPTEITASGDRLQPIHQFHLPPRLNFPPLTLVIILRPSVAIASAQLER